MVKEQPVGYLLICFNFNNIKTIPFLLFRNNKIHIQITLFFPEIVENHYMGIYKMNHRIT